MDDYIDLTEKQEVPKPKKIKKLKVGRIFLAVIVVLIILAGVYYEETISYADKMMKSTGLVSLTSLNNDIAASIGEEVITMQELEEEFESIPEMMRAFTRKSDILEKIVNQKILIKAANEAEIVVTDEEIDESIVQIKQENAFDDETFEEKLREINYTLEEFKEYRKDIILIDKYFEDVVFVGVDAGNEEIREYYDENLELFEIGDRVEVSHILVSTEERTDEEALEIVEEIKSKLGDGEFSVLVEEYSEDPGKAMNKGVYEFGKGEMVPEFEQASFALKNTDDISEPVKTDYGYHIIKLHGKKQAKTLEFEEVEQEIKEILEGEIKNQKAQQAVDDLREKYDVEVFYYEEE